MPNPGIREEALETCDSVTGWTVLGDDTDNLAVTNRRVHGAYALEFDKIDGQGGTVFAGAYKTVALKIDQYSVQDQINWYVYVSTVADVVRAILRIGSSAVNNVEYYYPDTSLAAGLFAHCHKPIYSFDVKNGTGCDFSNITYIAVAIEFDAQDDTLADIAVDNISIMPSGLTHT